MPDIPNARQWGDVPSKRRIDASENGIAGGQARLPRRLDVSLNVLAISGGGANGAFAAGLLAGWSKAGTRPEFHVVTGVSAGALAAPFAFLGPGYDDAMRDLFTGSSASDIISMRPRLLALLGDSLADPAPLQTMIQRNFTAEMMRTIAAEHRKGRRLFAGTTHVFAGRLVIWDIGAIALSGRPGALELIHRILLASSALPILLPPVYFEVEAGGRRYSEMHVDGGMTRQVFVAPPAFDWPAMSRALGTNGGVDFYVIRNGRAQSEYMVMQDSLVPLGEHAMHLLALSQGIGDLYTIYVRARREAARFHAAWIDNDFAAPWTGWYDPDYVRAVFEHGLRKAAGGTPWHLSPPGSEAGDR